MILGGTELEHEEYKLARSDCSTCRKAHVCKFHDKIISIVGNLNSGIGETEDELGNTYSIYISCNFDDEPCKISFSKDISIINQGACHICDYMKICKHRVTESKRFKNKLAQEILLNTVKDIEKDLDELCPDTFQVFVKCKDYCANKSAKASAKKLGIETDTDYDYLIPPPIEEANH